MPAARFAAQDWLALRCGLCELTAAGRLLAPLSSPIEPADEKCLINMSTLMSCCAGHGGGDG